MVVYICNISTWENDAGGLQAWTMYVDFCKLGKPSEIYLKRQELYIKNASYKINFRPVAFELYK